MSFRGASGRMAVVVLGDANADLTLELPTWPAPGHDGQAQAVRWGSGGSALNVASAFASLGAESRLVACVGADPLAAIALGEARARGVELRFVERRRGARTGLCVVGVDRRGERTFLSHRGANIELRARRAHAALDGASLLHVSAYALLAPPQSDAAIDLIARAVRAGVPVSLDLGGPPARLCRETIAALTPSLWALFGNEAEIAALGPRRTPRAVVTGLLAQGVRLVAMKQGAAGCTLARPGPPAVWHRSPAHEVTVRDTTACGDAFVAGCAFAMLRGAPLRSAAAFANLLGALTAERPGAARSLPSRAEIEARAGRRHRALRDALDAEVVHAADD